MASEKKITKGAQIYFVSGSDEAEVKQVAKDLAAKLAPAEGGDFGIETIDGDVQLVDQVLEKIRQTTEALLTIPFLGGEKLVWLKSASFLGDSITGRSERVLESLARFLHLLETGLSEGTILLLSAPEADKRRAFYKGISKVAKISIHDRPELGRDGEDALVAWVGELARQRGLHFEGMALEMLAARAGSDSRQMQSELEKLEIAMGHTRAVTEADIQNLVSPTRKGVIFDLSNEIARRNLPGALHTLSSLLRQEESAVGLLLSAIVPTIRNLLLIKDLFNQHHLKPPAKAFYFGATLKRLPASATYHLPRKKDGEINAYPLGIAAMHVHSFTLNELQSAFRACAQANLTLVTEQIDPKVVLQRLLIRILGKQTEKRT